VKSSMIDFVSPSWSLGNVEAFHSYRADVTKYEFVVDAYADGVVHEDHIWDALAGLDFAIEEIQWHINHPGKRMVQNFVL